MLSDTTRAFAEATTDAQRLLDTIARRVAEVIRDSCVVLLLDDAGKVLTPAAMFDPDPETLRALGDTLSESFALETHPVTRRVLETGEPLFAPRLDLEQLRPPQTTPRYFAFMERIGLHSMLIVPLRIHGRAIGQLTMTRFRPETPPFDDRDLGLAQSLADHAALAVSNSRLLTEARRSYAAERAARDAEQRSTLAQRHAEARFNALFESGIVAITAGSLDGRLLEVNDAFLELVGYSRDDFAAGRVKTRDLTAPEWKERDSQAIATLASTRIGGLREKEYIHKDGRRVPVLIGSAMLAGETDEAISFILDLTERNAAHAAVEQLRNEHAIDQQFRSILESAPDAMVVIDGGGAIVLVNSQAETKFGYTRTELIGRPIALLIPDRARQGAVAVGLELHARRKDGTEFPIELSSSPLETDAGVWISNAIRDITDRKRAEGQRAQLAAIVDASDDAIIGKTLDGLITSWNTGAEHLFGYTADEIVGKSITVLLPPGREAEELAILDSLARGEIQRFETVRRRKDGRDIDVAVTSSPVRDAAGRIVGISKVARDITERRRNDEALAHAKEAAEAASRELEAFSYSVAHDLRAPLRGMNGFARALLDCYRDSFDAEGKDWLEEILANATKMGALIDALLSLSRVTRSEIKRVQVDLSRMVRAAGTQLAAAEPDRKVELVVQDQLVADVDPHLARALIDNLVGNAWKFTSKTSAARIEVGAIENGCNREFYVRDNGAGFDATFASKLFGPFQRLHSADEFPGTGIGLATVQRIVHRHGGWVRAEGAVGRGATFSFAFGAAS